MAKTPKTPKTPKVKATKTDKRQAGAVAGPDMRRIEKGTKK